MDECLDTPYVVQRTKTNKYWCERRKTWLVDKNAFRRLILFLWIRFPHSPERSDLRDDRHETTARWPIFDGILQWRAAARAFAQRMCVRWMDGWMDVARASFAVGEPRPFIVSKEHTRSRAVMSRIPTRQKRLFWSGRAVKSIEGLNVMCRDNIVSTSWYIYFFSHEFPWCIRSHAGPEAFSTPTLSLMKTKIEKNTLSFECIAIHRSHATLCLAIFIEIKVVISCSASRSVCLCVYSTTNFEDKQCEQFPIPNHSPSSNYFLLPATNGADHLLVWLDAANTNESYNNADSCLTWPMCIE